jgi:PIN domain nuclease of toxin-antitoxin system
MHRSSSSTRHQNSYEASPRYTHTFIWWATSSENLPNQVLDRLEDSQNNLLLSVASVWEIQIKCQNGKLQLNRSLSQLVVNQQTNNDLKMLSIVLDHVYALQMLPNVHRDPFDRIMIAQAVVEDLPFVSADALLDGYPIQRIW